LNDYSLVHLLRSKFVLYTNATNDDDDDDNDVDDAVLQVL